MTKDLIILNKSIIEIIQNLSLIPDLFEDVLDDASDTLKGEKLMGCLNKIDSEYTEMQKNIVSILKKASIQEDMENDNELIKAQVTNHGFLIKEKKDE